MATKEEVTTYLSGRLTGYLNKEFMIAFEKTCMTNIPDLDSDLKDYGQEEAKTGIVLHGINVC